MQQWTAENIMYKLLKCLINFYSDNCLPNYFVRDNNMIDHGDQTEIKQYVSPLRDIKANILQVMVSHIDTHHKLLVEFDKTLPEYFNFDNNEKIYQLIKYNLNSFFRKHNLYIGTTLKYILIRYLNSTIQMRSFLFMVRWKY